MRHALEIDFFSKEQDIAWLEVSVHKRGDGRVQILHPSRHTWQATNQLESDEGIVRCPHSPLVISRKYDTNCVS